MADEKHLFSRPLAVASQFASSTAAPPSGRGAGVLQPLEDGRRGPFGASGPPGKRRAARAAGGGRTQGRREHVWRGGERRARDGGRGRGGCPLGRWLPVMYSRVHKQEPSLLACVTEELNVFEHPISFVGRGCEELPAFS